MHKSHLFYKEKTFPEYLFCYWSLAIYKGEFKIITINSKILVNLNNYKKNCNWQAAWSNPVIISVMSHFYFLSYYSSVNIYHALFLLFSLSGEVHAINDNKW